MNDVNVFEKVRAGTIFTASIHRADQITEPHQLSQIPTSSGRGCKALFIVLGLAQGTLFLPAERSGQVRVRTVTDDVDPTCAKHEACLYGPSVFLCVTRFEARPLVQHPLRSHVSFCCSSETQQWTVFFKVGIWLSAWFWEKEPSYHASYHGLRSCAIRCCKSRARTQTCPGFFSTARSYNVNHCSTTTCTDHSSLSFISPAQRSCQNLSGSRTRLVRIRNTCLQFVGVPLCPFQHLRGFGWSDRFHLNAPMNYLFS